MNDTTKQKVMDIAMNLNRIGNWVADDFDGNQNKINVFINNTGGYVSDVKSLSNKLEITWINFMKVCPNLKNNLKNNAENFMTWGNILTHRASLIEN